MTAASTTNQVASFFRFSLLSSPLVWRASVSSVSPYARRGPFFFFLTGERRQPRAGGPDSAGRTRHAAEAVEAIVGAACLCERARIFVERTQYSAPAAQQSNCRDLFAAVATIDSSVGLLFKYRVAAFMPPPPPLPSRRRGERDFLAGMSYGHVKITDLALPSIRQ